MRQSIVIAAAVLMLAGLAPMAQAVPSQELISRSKHYNSKKVTYEGEAIGSVMVRGDFAWINVLDGSSAIGVWMPKELAAAVRATGNYKMRGDRVQVYGVFHSACPEHGGGLDIHAMSLAVMQGGIPISESLGGGKIVAMYALLGVLLCLMIILILRQRRKKS